MRRILTVTLNPALDLSTTVPVVEPGPKLRCTPPAREPGGGGVNVSRVIAKLGHDSRAVVALGGPTGMALQALLEAEGLAPDIIALPSDTRQSLSVTDRDGGQYRFILPGDPWDGDMLAACITRLADLIAAGDMVVFSGSLPPGVPPQALTDLAGLCDDLEALAVFDVSGPPLQALAEMAAPGAYLIRMDRREAGDLLGVLEPDADAALALARKLVAQGTARIVAIALGAEGGLVVTAETAIRTVPPKVPVVSTTGAGDSYLAGLVIGLAADWSLADAAAHATACAADAVTTPGTSLCSAEGVAGLLPKVKVTELPA
jgi:6-phosphofructokinase 2